MEQTKEEFEVSYNLRKFYSKKEMENIYKYLVSIYNDAVRYQGNSNLKVRREEILSIRDSQVCIVITNVDSMTNIPKIIEIQIKFIGIDDFGIDKTVEFKSSDNKLGGLTLFDFNEFINKFKFWIKQQ